MASTFIGMTYSLLAGPLLANDGGSGAKVKLYGGITGNSRKNISNHITTIEQTTGIRVD